MAVLRSSVSFKDGIVVVAFPGLGYIGTVTGRYLVDKLNLRWSGYIHSEKLPPVGRIKKGKLLYPINVFSGDGFHVVLSEVTPPEGEVWSIASSIVTKFRKEGGKLLFVVSGVLIGDEDSVYGIAANKRGEELMKKFGIKPVENGVVSGMSAALMLLSRDAGIPSVLLLGPASSMNDFRASVPVVRLLSSITGKDIPTEELEELVHKYEHELRMMKKHLETPSAPIYG